MIGKCLKLVLCWLDDRWREILLLLRYQEQYPIVIQNELNCSEISIGVKKILRDRGG